MPFKPLYCIYGKYTIPQRVILSLILHFALQNAYNVRVVINIAITEMVKPIIKNATTARDDCPNLKAEEVLEVKEGQYNWDTNDQALIKYIFFVGYFVGHLPGGWLADKIGARHVLGTGVLVSAILNLILPLSITKGGEYWGFIFCVIIRSLMGFFQGCIVPTIATFMSSWAPRKERAMLGGVAYGGGNLGNIMGIVFTGVIIYYTNSWANAFYVWGLMAIMWYFLFLFTAFSYPETHPFITEKELAYLKENLSKMPKDFTVPWVKIIKCIPIWAILAAQFGHDYVLYAMNTDLPKFIKDYLKMNVRNNGIVSAMPFVLSWISAIASGFLADYIVNKKLMSLLAMRKWLTIISIMGPASCNILAVYIGCSRLWVVFLCTFGMFWMGPFWSASKVNVNDLSRHYGGILMAIINGIGAWAGILGPWITGYFTPDGTLEQWRFVFWVMMLIAVLTSAAYLFFAKADRQEWDYWEGEFPGDEDCFVIPQRVVLAVVLHLAMQNAYNLRVVINIAITEMVKPGIKNSTKIIDDCPNLKAEENPSIKDGQYNWNSNDQALIKYIFFVGYFLGHLPGGWLGDKIGARHVTGTSLLLAAIFNLILPFSISTGGEYWGFMYCVAIRFMIGVFQGSIVPTIATFMSSWAPKKERAMLGGIAYGGGNLGNIVGIIFTGVIIYYTRSWSSPFYLWGLLTILWYILFLFTSFSYPETHPFISDGEKEFLQENLAKKATNFKVPWLQIAKCCPIWAILAAQFGHNYVLFAMNTDLPKFVKDYLKMNIKNNGIVSALPFIFCWISAIGSGFVADCITNRNLMSILTMRKLLTIISIIGPAMCNVAAVYIGCSRIWVVFLCTFGMFWMGPFWPALKVNVNDLSRHYGGILMAIINGIGAWAGVLAPWITGYFTPDGTLQQWRVVFWIMMVIAVATSLVYLFFAKADRQEWDYWEGEAREEPGASTAK
ncbi:uncharacterized protein LOC115881008 [Sitophilus oryzae]|uniref:Uncharacterized protein LOC115881008 n=1 Tax=Sitophilus oryzae TaxID=7048 RepID=A0A6J2XRU0_SITOR|nr:uncharacterized protein LOC115881008 [Sitophilus oryzae]